MPRRRLQKQKRGYKNPKLRIHQDPYESESEVYNGTFLHVSPSHLAGIFSIKEFQLGQNETALYELLLLLLCAIAWYVYQIYPLISIKHPEKSFVIKVYSAFYWLAFYFTTMKRISFVGYKRFSDTQKVLTLLLQLCWIGLIVHYSTIYVWSSILRVLNYCCFWFAYLLQYVLPFIMKTSTDLTEWIQKQSFYIASYCTLAVLLMIVLSSSGVMYSYVVDEIDKLVNGIKREAESRVFLSPSDYELEKELDREMDSEETPTHFLVAKDNALLKKVRREQRRAKRARAQK